MLSRMIRGRLGSGAAAASRRCTATTMAQLLTVAIPTYNRAAKLDRQLGWLSRNLSGLETACAALISDNASSDETPRVCSAWHDVLAAQRVRVTVHRNEQNVGPIPNIARCIAASTSRFTWVIGDDDHIPDGELAWVVDRLRADPDLATIVLNFNSVGMTVYDRCFRFPADRLGDGWDVMSDCLRQAPFGLAFMTAQVYRTEFAQAALRAWPQGTRNYDYQIFVTAYSGTLGRVLATRDTHVTYVTGDNIYERDKRVGLQLYADSLEVFLRLWRVGYPGELCRHMARQHLWGLKRRFAKRALQNNPLFTGLTAARVAGYAARLCLTRVHQGGRPLSRTVRGSLDHASDRFPSPEVPSDDEQGHDANANAC
jgi:Glycosyl transferase family 2